MYAATASRKRHNVTVRWNARDASAGGRKEANMKIAEAESILGVEDMTYDTTAIGVAYMRALRSANSPAERKRCAAARNTLERYVTSLKKSGQFGTLDKMSAAMSTVGLVRDAFGRHEAEQADTDDETPTGPSANDGIATGTEAMPNADSDRLAGTRRYPKSSTTVGDCDDTQRMPKIDKAYMKSHYAQARAACRPSGADDGGMSFWKAALLTLWDATPWRWFLCFWSAVIGVISDVLGLLGAVSPNARTITIVAAVTFWVGMMDRATGLLWTRAMPASARRIEGMR